MIVPCETDVHGQWLIAVLESTNDWHVIPVHDTREHTPDDCWCDPTLEDDVWMHHSADGREAYESGQRKPS